MKTSIGNAIALFAIAIVVMASCTFEEFGKHDATVDVQIEGVLAESSRTIGLDASWVSINVLNSSGTRVGSGTLAKISGVWKGSISISEIGTLTFIASAGSVADQVSWRGQNDLIVTGNGQSVTIVVEAPSIGNKGPAGGVIFLAKESYSDGWRYMEATTSDQSSSFIWSYVSGEGSQIDSEGTGLGVGTGLANSLAIIAQLGHSESSAKVCIDLISGGFDDWFLPSKDELNQMYLNRESIGNLNTGNYWSSSPHDLYYAWYQNFLSGGQSHDTYKTHIGFKVRGVRKF